MHTPLVSIICLCYNQQRFVKEAILSALEQTYENIELIVVDDASVDNSHQIINQMVEKHPKIKYFPLPENLGHCAAFNEGLKKAGGEYIIDLAADDILCSERVEEGVKAFQRGGDTCGVNFSNAERVDKSGRHISFHYPIDELGHSVVPVPEGDVFEEVIRRYFICSPTVMFRKDIIDAMGGYDASLAYEDFDLWIRTSRDYKYIYTDKVLMKKRVVSGSAGQKQFKIRSTYLHSTFRVCEKISKMIRNNSEKEALKKRIKYEITLSLRLISFEVALKYFRLLKSLK
ncbi:glycosyltransferase [Fulvivirga ulvae]|uniref:glycosyltransferase family 2 protein n=1 Tax=Fulvivirga ulvae TaxID=2904245 RepID=UPI001F35B383|nr:glycosyltransferase [Fulvivirga ulvae]UII32992.1 glycosyltransferase [Fulvivirga ulvae]